MKCTVTDALLGIIDVSQDPKKRFVHTHTHTHFLKWIYHK